jgi:hypothetical protein
VSEIYRTGSEGERLLSEWLTAKGRQVRPSDRKTFDLIVDGRYAEVKTSRAPYSELGFIGLTKAQFKALTDGVDFSVFVVCNSNDPANLEVVEILAADLLRETPKIEPVYYWYRSQLEKCRSSRAP